MNRIEESFEGNELYKSYVEAFAAYVQCVTALGGQVSDVQQHSPSGQYTWSVTLMKTQAAQLEVEACNSRFHEIETRFIHANRHRLSDPAEQERHFEAHIAPVLREHGSEVRTPVEFGSHEWDQLNAKYLEIADSHGSRAETPDGEGSTDSTTE